MEKANDIKLELEIIVEELKVKQTSIFPLRRILKMAFVLEELAINDSQCKSYLNTLHSNVKNLKETLTDGSDTDKLNFGKLIEEITEYLKSHYKVSTEEYYTNKFTVIGLIMGLSVSTLCSYLIYNRFDLLIISAISFTSLVAFRFYGVKIDKQKKREKRQI